MLKDLVGQSFGRLTVFEYCGTDKHQKRRWKCKCNCEDGNVIEVTTSQLTTGSTKSCGCLQRERTSKANKKYNRYDLSGKYGIGYTGNGEEFYCDLEDYDKIKDYCWENSNGYMITGDKNNRSKNIIMHRLIMDCSENDTAVDHINHNRKDNRKINLRICTDSQNNMNHVLRKDNSTGVTGVYYDKRINKWYSQIKIKGRKRITLGYFENKEDAIKTRKEAEEKYFGEYSYDNSMKLGGKVNV